eukprot:2819260-Rhodomonas_salina.1
MDIAQHGRRQIPQHFGSTHARRLLPQHFGSTLRDLSTGLSHSTRVGCYQESRGGLALYYTDPRSVLVAAYATSVPEISQYHMLDQYQSSHNTIRHVGTRYPIARYAGSVQELA